MAVDVGSGPVGAPTTSGGRAGYEAIVVGGGHNALVTASYLARAGRQVLVLERRNQLGGAAETSELGGVRVPRLAHTVGRLRPSVVRDLDLRLDMTSGFKCFSRVVLEDLDLRSVRSNGYAFQVEMNYRCFLSGFRVQEVPIVFVDRRVGKSKMGSHIVTEAMGVVLRLRLQRMFEGGGQSRVAKYSRMP